MNGNILKQSESNSSKLEYNNLYNSWNYFLHLHDNKDWTIKSYINMIQIDNVETAILLNDEIHYDLIKKSMMFLMKEDIKPMWEDVYNKDGGCFSFNWLYHNKRCRSLQKYKWHNIKP